MIQLHGRAVAQCPTPPARGWHWSHAATAAAGASRAAPSPLGHVSEHTAAEAGASPQICMRPIRMRPICVRHICSVRSVWAAPSSSSSLLLRLFFFLLLPLRPPSANGGSLPLRCAPTPLAPRCPCNCMWLQAATIAETSAPSVWGAVCWVVAAHRSRVCGNPTPVLVPSASQSLGFRPSGLGHRSKPATTACSSKPRGA